MGEQGKSKKGKLKQNRVIEKIEQYLESGLLTKADLTKSQP